MDNTIDLIPSNVREEYVKNCKLLESNIFSLLKSRYYLYAFSINGNLNKISNNAHKALIRHYIDLDKSNIDLCICKLLYDNDNHDSHPWTLPRHINWLNRLFRDNGINIAFGKMPHYQLEVDLCCLRNKSVAHTDANRTDVRIAIDSVYPIIDDIVNKYNEILFIGKHTLESGEEVSLNPFSQTFISTLMLSCAFGVDNILSINL